MFKRSQGSDRARRHAELHFSFCVQVDKDCNSAEACCYMLPI